MSDYILSLLYNTYVFEVTLAGCFAYLCACRISAIDIGVGDNDESTTNFEVNHYHESNGASDEAESK